MEEFFYSPGKLSDLPQTAVSDKLELVIKWLICQSLSS
jgi:hypothetical protein